MLNAKESLHHARQRIKPEGALICGTLAGASFVAIPAMQTTLTYVFNEISREVPTDVLRFAAIGLLGLINLASITVESRTLKKQQYSASPFASAANIATGRSVGSSILGHSINFGQSFLVNPVHLVSLPALMSGDQGRLIAENMMAVSLSLGIWNIGFNALISSNHIDPVVKGIRNVGDIVSNKLRNKK